MRHKLALLRPLEDWLCFNSRYCPLLHDGDLVVAKSSAGSARRPSHLGSRHYLHPRLGPRPLHSHIPHKIFTHELLRGPWHQRSIRRCHYPRSMSNLPAYFIPLGSLNTRRQLWRSKTAGSIHWHFQSSHGRDCGNTADARAMGPAHGCGEKIYLERHVWFGHHVCPFPSSSLQFPCTDIRGASS